MQNSETTGTMLKMINVSKSFRDTFGLKVKKHVLSSINLEIKKGRILGIVGNSGSGKSTLARIILKLIKHDTGTIYLDGKDITNIKGRALKELRKKMQIVFQHPESSLNPQMTIYKNLLEPIIIQNIELTMHPRDYIIEKLNLVGLNEDLLERYPSEVSGGEAQRIVIARALIFNAEFLILDEPTSMLDVSIQSQIINLLKKLQEDFNLTYIFISHDLDLVSHFSDDLAIMDEGKIIEMGYTAQVLSNPKTEFTKNMIQSFNKLKI